MTAEKLWGAGWVLLGGAVVAGASRLDRLEAQGVPGFAAPGLLPALLGIVIAVCGVLLVLRSRSPAKSPGDAAVDAEAGHASALPWRTVTLTLLLCLAFAMLLVGRGLPFGAATAIYLFVHVGILQWHERGAAAGQRLRGLLLAAAVAVGGGLAVPYVFEQLFLVRLP